MTTATAKKPARTLTYNALAGALYITQGTKEDAYWLDKLPHDLGPQVRCVRLSKFIATKKDNSPDNYDVRVDLTTRQGTCECMGHLRHGHKTVCRHVAAVLVLCDRNHL